MKNGMDFKRGQLAKEIEDPFYLKDPILLDLFEKCKPPKEAYLYFPKGEDIIVINNKKPESSYRKIYYNVPFFDMEKKYINKLREIINSDPAIKLPYFFDDELLLRFLYADDCELKEVFKRLKKYIEWSNKTFPLSIQPKSRTIEILNKGFIYAYGRDCKFRPILIFRLEQFVKNEKIYSVQEVLEAGIFLGQFVINHMLLPGQVERWNLLVNLRKATLLSLPDHIKKLLPIMNEGFISRMNKTYIIGMNFFFRFLYKIVCAFLRESTVKKIKILDGKKDQSIFEEIRKDNIEMSMGGTAPDARIGEENGIFPPRMPSENFILDSQRKEDILISEEEYIKKYKNGEIPKDFASPFILDKLKEEENNQIKEDNLDKNEFDKQIIQKNNEIESEKNRTIDIHKKQEIVARTKEKFEIDKQLFIKKQQEINKVKTFMKSGWEFKEEKINTNSVNYQNNKNLHKNIINEINSLCNKRKFFISNIYKISNTNEN